MANLKDDLDFMTIHYERLIDNWIEDYRAGFITARELSECIAGECLEWENERQATLEEWSTERSYGIDQKEEN